MAEQKPPQKPPSNDSPKVIPPKPSPPDNIEVRESVDEIKYGGQSQGQVKKE